MLLTVRGFQLNPKDLNLCEESSELSKVAAEDYRESVIQAVLHYYSGEDGNNAAVADPLHSVIPTNSNNKIWLWAILPLSIMILACLGFSTPSPIPQIDMAESYLQTGQEAITRMDYDLALADLTESDRLFKARGFVNPQVSLLLGKVHSYFGHQTEAAEVLNQGLTTQQSFSKNSSMALQLTNEIMEMSVQFGRWRDAYEKCEEALKLFEKSKETDEKLRLLWFCAISFYSSYQTRSGHELVDKWKPRMMPDSPRSNSTLLLLEAHQMKVVGKTQEAIAKSEDGLKLNTMVDSYIPAFSLRHLAKRYSLKKKMIKALELYKQAETMLAAHYPHSFEHTSLGSTREGPLRHARCLCEMGYTTKLVKKKKR